MARQPDPDTGKTEFIKTSTKFTPATHSFKKEDYVIALAQPWQTLSFMCSNQSLMMDC